MQEYNGHPSHAHWNVNLWLFNDEGLYRLVQAALEANSDKDSAARWLLTQLPPKTPDGVPYSFTTIRHALVGETVS